MLDQSAIEGMLSHLLLSTVLVRFLSLLIKSETVSFSRAGSNNFISLSQAELRWTPRGLAFPRSNTMAKAYARFKANTFVFPLLQSSPAVLDDIEVNQANLSTLLRYEST